MINDFGAALNTKRAADMNLVLKLAYEERSRRAADMEWAESCDKTLSLKVVCPLNVSAKMSHLIVCTNKIYSIINIDYDRLNQEMYLYLEEVREIAE